MSVQPVEAVWFFRYPKGPFRALYGRKPGTLYSKDFLQASGACKDALDTAFGKTPGGEVPITFRWPGGSVPGTLRDTTGTEATPRDQLAWRTNEPPLPWTLTTAPDPIKAILGNPSARDESGAEAVLAALEGADIDPWILGVKLAGEPGVLHVRAYLGRPPAGYEYASTSQLPEPLRMEMAKVPAGSCGVLIGGPAKVVRAGAIVDRILSALERSPNVLLVGPPGTGKTVALEDLRGLFESGAVSLMFDATNTFDAWRTYLPADRIAMALVFHPSYSYEEFVIGLVPKPGGAFALEARPGPLLSLAHWAQDPSRTALLAIDEFNRGNAAAIFGDTLALLDKEKRQDVAAGLAGAWVARAYPRETVEVAPTFANSAGTLVGPDLRLPASLKIVAALNSSDRSVAPLDAALRRRFAILSVAPDYDVLAAHLGVTTPPDGFTPPADFATWTLEQALQTAVALLRSLNRRLSAILGDDFLLGHAALWSISGSATPQIVQSLALAFDEQIVGTLRLTFVDQDDQLAAVLKVTTAAPGTTTAVLGRWEPPDPSLGTLAERRLRITRLDTLSLAEAAEVLRTLI